MIRRPSDMWPRFLLEEYRRLVLYPPAMVRADLMAAPADDTTTTYAR